MVGFVLVRVSDLCYFFFRRVLFRVFRLFVLLFFSFLFGLDSFCAAGMLLVFSSSVGNFLALFL